MGASVSVSFIDYSKTDVYLVLIFALSRRDRWPSCNTERQSVLHDGHHQPNLIRTYSYIEWNENGGIYLKDRIWNCVFVQQQHHQKWLQQVGLVALTS